MINRILGFRVIDTYNIVKKYHGRCRERACLGRYERYSLYRFQGREVAQYHGRGQGCSCVRASLYDCLSTGCRAVELHRTSLREPNGHLGGDSTGKVRGVEVEIGAAGDVNVSIFKVQNIVRKMCLRSEDGFQLWIVFCDSDHDARKERIKEYSHFGSGVVDSNHGHISCKLLVELIAGGAVVRTVSPNYRYSVRSSREAWVCKSVIWRLDGIPLRG